MGRLTTGHVTAIFLGCLIAGCGEPTVELRVAEDPFRFQISGCLFQGGGCSAQLGPAIDLEAAVNACLVVEAVDTDLRVFAPLAVRANDVELVGDAQTFAVPRQSAIRAAVFIFRAATDANARCRGDLTAAAACDDDTGCALKLFQPDVFLEEGTPIQFRPEGQARCSSEWATGMAPAESCNSEDDDCDGLADEDFPNVGEVCRRGMGADCGTPGEFVCAGNGAAVECNAPDPADEEEVCDGADNDCDGMTDEGLDSCCEPGEVRDCNVGLEAPCTQGTETCVVAGNAVRGQFGDCVDGAGNEVVRPLMEVCDLADNDCDGTADEGFQLDGDGPGVGQPCVEGQGVCAGEGVVGCEMGQAVCMVGTPGEMATVEGDEDGDCDGLDNDCDGETDESEDASGPLSRACWDGTVGAPGIGICREGTQSCVDGAFEDRCAGQVLASTEDARDPVNTPGACEEEQPIDDDCDGEVEEGINACGTCGEPPIELCNEVDDDCDLTVDEGFELDTDPENCGACGLRCDLNDRGEVIANTVFVCENQVCRIDGCTAPQFVDCDGDPSNGCEADTRAEEILDFDDDDCDGIDDASDNPRYIYVSAAAGNDMAAGSFDEPIRTFSEAIRRVEEDRVGREPAEWSPKTLVLSLGEHDIGENRGPGDADITDGLVMPDRVSILGGYAYDREADTWRRRPRSPEEATVITGAPVVLVFTEASEPIIIDNVRIQATDAVGRTSAAVVVDGGEDLNADLIGDRITVRRSQLVGGDGGNGEGGFSGSRGSDFGNAASGVSGSRANDPDCAGCGGRAADETVCRDSGNGAAGGPGGDSGTPGAEGVSADDGAAAPGGQAVPAEFPGADGFAGRQGDAGDNSEASPADGYVRAEVFGRALWGPRGSAAAGRGLPGGGGGGGGGAGLLANGEPGAGGGGGGAGGCGATGATGATGGYGSFGLVVRTASVQLRDTYIVAGQGGRGGPGSSGGVGGPGGDGGLGAEGVAGAAAGGDGGGGGQGGCGGNSGGGAGGPSYAILRISPTAAPANVNQSTVSFLDPDGGLPLGNQNTAADDYLEVRVGGRGGQGGQVPNDCNGEAAESGADGFAGRIACCRAGNECSLLGDNTMGCN